jgi:hypothetical protein
MFASAFDYDPTVLQNFEIGLSNLHAATQIIQLKSYNLCAKVTKPFKYGERRSISCIGKGRYLLVQKNDKSALTLCGVEVYRGK